MNILKSKVFWIIVAVIVVITIVVVIFARYKRMKAVATDNNDVTAGTKAIYSNAVTSWPLKEGSKGMEVQILQKYLNTLGASKGIKLDVDGIFGPLTLQALRTVLGTDKIEKTFYQERVANLDTRLK